MTYESSLAKWLRRLVYATALIPLVIFAQYMSPFHFGKVIVFRSIVQIMAALYILLVWRDRSYAPKSNPILWAFVAFTAVFTLTSITSVAPTQSFWGTLERMGGLFTFWHYLVFYIIATSVMRTRRDWRVLLDLMIAVGVTSALYGLLQRFNMGLILGSGGRERIFGTIGNPALFAGYQILVAYLALTFVFLRYAIEIPERGFERGARGIGIGVGAAILVGLIANGVAWLQGLWIVPLGYAMYGVLLCGAEFFRGARWIYAGAAGLMFLAVMMTAVRGSLLAVIAASLLFVLMWSVLNRSKKAKNALVIGITGLAVLVFLAIAFRNTSFVQNSPYLKRVTDFSAKTTTVQTRFWAWSAGFKGWHDNAKTMILGWGPENFNVPFSKYFNPKFFTGPGSETFFDRAHNMFIEIFVTMGALGLLAYLSIFATLFLALFRMMRLPGDGRIIGIGFTSLAVAYIIHNAFIFDTSANFITFFMVLAFVTHISASGIEGAENQKSRPMPWTTLQKTTAAALSVLAAIAVYATNVRPTMANFATTRAIVAGWQGDWTTAISKYRQSIGYGAPGYYEYRHRFAQYLLEVVGSADTAKIPNFNQVVLEVIDEVQKNVDENPMDYLPYLYQSRLYIMLGKNDPDSVYNDKALEKSMKALEISPTFVRTYYEIAQAYLNKDDSAVAFDWFKKAMELNPAVSVTYWYMGSVRYQVAAKAQDSAGMQEAIGYFESALQRGYSPSEGDSQKLISAYLRMNNIKGAVPLIEQLTRRYPENAQYWASLAAVYLRTGRIPDAITAARKVIELSANDQDLKAQAEQFIRDLGGTP